jgi:uncharacterized protein (DUF1778 family)
VATNPRELRWNLRVEDSEDALVRAASKAADTSYSNFIRGAALAEAQRVLADRDRFSLPQESWQQFTQLLERPPRVPEGLRRLYAKPSVFE